MATYAPITGAPLRAPLQPTFALANRKAIEAEIERLIGLLDASDAPSDDLEPEDDYCLAGDDGCGMRRSAQGGMAWGSKEEEPYHFKPRYGVDQSRGPVNVLEAERAYRALGLDA